MFTGFVREITERKQLEEELRQQAERLVKADRAKDHFLAMLAHELRNPLGAISNALHLLKWRGGEDPRFSRPLEIIERQVLHQSHMLDDLLNVSRIARGKTTLNPIPLDLVRLIHDVAEDHRSALKEAGLNLTLELPDEPAWSQGDPTRLAQVLGNLLQNATKFTDRGGRVTVRAAVEPTSHRAAVTVEDTGIGMEPELLPRVFESFTQAERTLNRSRGGLGLGLALVKGLVELHGGEVRAESEGPGRGARLTFWLPLSGDSALPQPPSLAHAVPPGPLRILVVEDNSDAAESLRDLLETVDYTVALAGTGPAGVAAARKFRPDVVLCDIGLPGMDGYELAAALRRDPTTAAARLIAVSGYGQEEDRRRSHEAGFDWHLTKPIDFDELLRLLEGVQGRTA